MRNTSARRRSILLSRTLRLVTCLALLVSVMTSPIRPGVYRGISHPNHLKRNFGIPGKVHSSPRPHIPTPVRVRVVKAISSQSKLVGAALSHYVRINPACLASHRPEALHDSAPFRLDRSYHSPRC